MPDIYSPDLTGNRRFQTYLNQFGATTGRVPSSAILDSIIQGELDAAERRRQANRAFTERTREFDVSQQNAAEQAAAAREAGLVGAGTQLAGTGLMLRALTKKPGEDFFVNPFASKGVPVESATGIGRMNPLFPSPPPFTSNVAPLETAYPAATGFETLETIKGPSYIPSSTFPVAKLPPNDLAAASQANTLRAAGETGLTATSLPVAPTETPFIAGELAPWEGGVAESMSFPAAEGAGGGSMFPAWAGPAGLALAAYEGSRFLGSRFGENTLARNVLTHPISGVFGESLKGAGKLTRIKELGHAGQFWEDVEEKVIQQPIDFVTNAISGGISRLADLFG